VRITGTLEAFANAVRCGAGQQVEIQRRAARAGEYSTIARVLTNAAGGFSATTTAERTSFFRARVAQDAECMGTVSARERVDVSPALRLITRTARLSANRTIRVQVDCRTNDGPCNGTVKLRTITRIGGRARTLPTASFQAPGNARRSVTVRVGPATQRLLRRVRTIRARAFIVGRDANGNASGTTALVTIRTR